MHSDKAGDFTAPLFARFLTNHKTIDHTFTSGYNPQANGTAERSVGLIKSLAGRALSSSSLDAGYWSYAVRYAAQSLLCHALQKTQKSLPFGSTVVAQVLGHQDVKFPEPRSLPGRLLFWDHLRDQVSHVLCAPETPDDEPLVYRAGLSGITLMISLHLILDLTQRRSLTSLWELKMTRRELTLEMTFVILTLMMKTTMMSFLRLPSVNLMLYLLIVHSLFFSCRLRIQQEMKH